MVKIEGHEFPEDLYYHREHMWVRLEDGKARVGYNAWAAAAAGKLVSLKTRPAGKEVAAGKTLGSVESGEWGGSLKVPLSGTILEINPALEGGASGSNAALSGDGWVAVIKPSSLDAELKSLIKGTDKAALEAWIKEEKAKAGG